MVSGQEYYQQNDAYVDVDGGVSEEVDHESWVLFQQDYPQMKIIVTMGGLPVEL